MTALLEIKIPDLGTTDPVEIIEVLINRGDTISPEQTIAVMEGDKATMDLPASGGGVVKEVRIKVGDKVGEGLVVAVLEAGDDTKTASKTEDTSEAETKVEPQAKPQTQIKAPPTPNPVAVTTAPNTSTHATPSVRLFARELGVDLALIKQGSGRKGRIIKEDVQNYVKQSISQPSGGGIPALPEVDFAPFGDSEIQPLNKIKRLTGQHISRVCLNVPMVTQHDEADITEMEAFRRENNANKSAVKLTGLVFIIKALLSGLAKFPQFNSSLSSDGQCLIYKKYFNIGIAVATPNGLVVPVIKNADQLGLVQLSTALAALSSKARDGKLTAGEMQGGCMTISSLGGIGGTSFTPIINAPEVAILGVSRAKMQPIWDGAEFVPRLMLPLDLTYDHRVIDGAEAAQFLVAICEYLADVRRLLL